jgi:hypothetical protein
MAGPLLRFGLHLLWKQNWRSTILMLFGAKQFLSSGHVPRSLFLSQQATRNSSSSGQEQTFTAALRPPQQKT